MKFANSDTVGIKFSTWISDAIITEEELRFLTTSATNTGEDVTFKVIGTFEGTITDISQVDLNQLSEDNSLIQATKWLANFQSGLTTQFYDVADPTDPVPLPVEIPEFGYSNDGRLFVGPLWACHLWYENQKTGEDLTTAQKFVDIVEVLLDSNGSPLKDVDGNQLYALKEGVVIY